MSFFKLSLFLKTGLRLHFEKIIENLLFLRNFIFSFTNSLLISFWKGIKHPGRIKLSCSSLSSWILSCKHNRKTETICMFQCFFVQNNKRLKHTFAVTTHLFWQELMPIVSHSLLIPELLFKKFSIRLKKSLEDVSWNVCSALSRISFSFLSE